MLRFNLILAAIFTSSISIPMALADDSDYLVVTTCYSDLNADGHFERIVVTMGTHPEDRYLEVFYDIDPMQKEMIIETSKRTLVSPDGKIGEEFVEEVVLTDQGTEIALLIRDRTRGYFRGPQSRGEIVPLSKCWDDVFYF